MLKISIQDDPHMPTLKLEGKLVGPWAQELNRVWDALEPSVATKKLRLDIRGMTYADKIGTRNLQRICRSMDAEILADTPLTKHFAALTMGKIQPNKHEEM